VGLVARKCFRRRHSQHVFSVCQRGRTHLLLVTLATNDADGVVTGDAKLVLGAEFVEFA
jgi:hypothetical protein